jgi:hypothetical protein
MRELLPKDWPPYSMVADGMLLERLEEIIKTALSLATPEQRYEVRHNPVKVVLYIPTEPDLELVITGMKIHGNNIVLSLSRPF